MVSAWWYRVVILCDSGWIVGSRYRTNAAMSSLPIHLELQHHLTFTPSQLQHSEIIAMKLTHGLTAALAGFASAASSQQPAQVYLLPSSDAASTQSPATISASLARLIFLQRLSPFGQGPSIIDGAGGADLDTVVKTMNRFGKAPPSLHPESELSPQLVLILEDMTTEQMSELQKQVKGAYKGMKPAFEISNPPSTRAHDDLVEIDFYNAGLTSHTKCDIELVIDPQNEKCWDAAANANVAKYNVLEVRHAQMTWCRTMTDLF